MALRNRSSGTAKEVAEIKQLLSDLGHRFRALAEAAASDASAAGTAVPDKLSECLSEFAGQMQEIAEGIESEAVRLGASARAKVEEEVGLHPFTSLAIAVGVGFCLGLLSRR
jgi:ElaB/YqjD/DUF883 family membrane-anchored ribosome-binding protein